MSIVLTEEQLAAVKRGEPLRISSDGTDFVVIRADLYERLGHPFDDSDFDPREAYPFIEKVMAEDDASDPTLESYQHYRKAMLDLP